MVKIDCKIINLSLPNLACFAPWRESIPASSISGYRKIYANRNSFNYSERRSFGSASLDTGRAQVLQVDKSLGRWQRRLDCSCFGHEGDDLSHSFDVNLALPGQHVALGLKV